MSTDPIVTEIRKLPELRSARFDFDLRAIVKDAQQRDADGDRQIIRLPPRPVVAASVRGTSPS